MVSEGGNGEGGRSTAAKRGDNNAEIAIAGWEVNGDAGGGSMGRARRELSFVHNSKRENALM